MLLEFAGKTVLDLGCGFGWHCRYAIENGAKSVVGIDLFGKVPGSIETDFYSYVIDGKFGFRADGKKEPFP